MRKYAARTDGNHSEIVRELRKIGCSVLSLSRVGGGCPDLAVGRNYRTMLLEIKDGSKPPSQRGLTPDQEKFSAAWRGHYAVVTSVQDAIDVITEATCT